MHSDALGRERGHFGSPFPERDLSVPDMHLDTNRRVANVRELNSGRRCVGSTPTAWQRSVKASIRTELTGMVWHGRGL